jgi:hypothetical protein
MTDIGYLSKRITAVVSHLPQIKEAGVYFLKLNGPFLPLPKSTKF